MVIHAWCWGVGEPDRSQDAISNHAPFGQIFITAVGDCLRWLIHTLKKHECQRGGGGGVHPPPVWNQSQISPDHWQLTNHIVIHLRPAAKGMHQSGRRISFGAEINARDSRATWAIWLGGGGWPNILSYRHMAADRRILPSPRRKGELWSRKEPRSHKENKRCSSQIKCCLSRQKVVNQDLLWIL